MRGEFFSSISLTPGSNNLIFNASGKNFSNFAATAASATGSARVTASKTSGSCAILFSVLFSRSIFCEIVEATALTTIVAESCRACAILVLANQ